MYTAERQRAQPYLNHISQPLFEQWYLLHHRMVRVVTNRLQFAEQVRQFLYYAELLAEYTYDQPDQLPVEIPVALLWQAGERLYRPVALTCYIFATRPDEPFPPAPAEAKPDDIEWEEITGVDGPLRARWKRGSLRFREYQPYPDVSGRICSVMDKVDLHASIFVEKPEITVPWFLMRFVFYMVIGAMFGIDGYEILHAGAVALDETAGALLVGSPGSGKSTLVLSCLKQGMHLLADDVLFLAKDDGVVKIYSFPEDIGVREGSFDLLKHYDFMQTIAKDNRQKAFVDVQRYFQGQVVSSCPARALLFISAKRRDAEFRAEPITPVQAVSILMQEFISQQHAKDGEADYMFGIFGDLAAQAPAYQLWLTPDIRYNALQVRDLLERYRQGA
ncbi:MAG TPA: hypothetical protein VKV40_03365 [Ktedonobacteraceae bacterium]|nr:hypothetical protein [Ktedonobacteraceae bacterium]